MLALNCYNKRNPKKGIERPTSSPTSRSKFISEVTTKEIPKRELRVPERRPREAAGQSAVTTKEIPKRELRDYNRLPKRYRSQSYNKRNPKKGIESA
jgi:thioester reductase-like protein